MVERLRHRGPDEDQIWTLGQVSLGHTRLRIIDLSDAGRQPMVSPDGRFVLIYNGEVYNFRELRGILEDRGRQFRSRSDTEVVLRAWEEWGPAGVGRFNGMYAFAVWDRHQGRLHLVRDRLGIKPLYWHFDGCGTFVFASEVRALLASGVVKRELDRSLLPAFLSQQTVPTPRTLVEGVRLMPPGCLMRVDLKDGKASSPEIRRYWDALGGATRRRPAMRGIPRQEVIRGLRERLEVAVERRMVSDVPLGAFLSGGVDSTAVVGLMRRASAHPVRTFTVAFDEIGYDDGPFARHAAERLGSDHTEIRLSDEELVAQVPEAVGSQDHPSGDGINTWIISRAVRQAGVTVALSGLGGDELFGGYPSFRRLAALHKVGPILRLVPKGIRRATGALLESAIPGVASQKMSELLVTSGRIAQTYAILRGVFASRQLETLLENEGLRGREVSLEQPYQTDLDLGFRDNPETPILARASYAELSCYLRDVLLRDTDQMSMAHSLEVRVPLLDHELVEHALALPDSLRAPGSPPKRSFAEVVADLLPEAVANRRKAGFVMPFDRWMRGPLRRFCEEGVEVAATHPAFRATAVESVWQEFLAADPRVPWSRPWLLVTLGHWLDSEGLLSVT